MTRIFSIIAAVAALAGVLSPNASAKPETAVESIHDFINTSLRQSNLPEVHWTDLRTEDEYYVWSKSSDFFIKNTIVSITELDREVGHPLSQLFYSGYSATWIVMRDTLGPDKDPTGDISLRHRLCYVGAWMAEYKRINGATIPAGETFNIADTHSEIASSDKNNASIDEGFTIGEHFGVAVCDLLLVV